MSQIRISLFANSSVGVEAAYNHSSVKNNEIGGGYMLYDSGKKKNIPGLEKTESSLCFVDPSVNVGYSRFFGNCHMGLSGDISFFILVDDLIFSSYCLTSIFNLRGSERVCPTIDKLDICCYIASVSFSSICGLGVFYSKEWFFGEFGFCKYGGTNVC